MYVHGVGTHIDPYVRRITHLRTRKYIYIDTQEQRHPDVDVQDQTHTYIYTHLLTHTHPHTHTCAHIYANSYLFFLPNTYTDPLPPVGRAVIKLFFSPKISTHDPLPLVGQPVITQTLHCTVVKTADHATLSLCLHSGASLHSSSASVPIKHVIGTESCNSVTELLIRWQDGRGVMVSLVMPLSACLVRI